SVYRRACGLGADLSVFPELSLPGYPPKDLLDQDDFIRAGLRELKALARSAGRVGLIVGCVEPNSSGRGKPFHNAAALLHRGKIAARRYKTLIPTYDVFDEGRYFEPAPSNTPVGFLGMKLGLSVCEDAWNEGGFWPRPLYGADPMRALAKAGADLLINIAASPYHRGKASLRRRMLARHASRNRVPLLYCALVGGNDELVFDGASMALDARGRLAARARSFEEDVVLWDSGAHLPPVPPEPLGTVEEVYRALLLGLRDYARKCGFKKAVLGLSGGIDSALVCALAADALGPGQVTGVSMPSMYSSPGSVSDARALTRNLGVRMLSIPISRMHLAARRALSEGLGEDPGALAREPDLADQNLQARMRGVVLMGLSNKTGALLLATGNKSELSTGYCTLYGDMNGGLALIGD
ncbi:MAG: NAD(+) synthase, partial [Elusimicrobiota bacterium]